MKKIFIAAICFILSATLTFADVAPRPGWWVANTDKSYADLIADVKTAAKAQKFGIVTQAGPTKAARSRGITIPGNRVIGIFNNAYAVRVLNLSTAAMIEAPIRMYVTENEDGTATLSYKLPSSVFAPYLDEAGPELTLIAAELDTAFQIIGETAAN